MGAGWEEKARRVRTERSVVRWELTLQPGLRGVACFMVVIDVPRDRKSNVVREGGGEESIHLLLALVV